MLGIVKVFYQDFRSNGATLNEDELSLNEKDSILIATYHINALRKKLESTDIELPVSVSMVDICDVLFRVFNTLPTEFTTNPAGFTTIGHTSMSVGDYVTIENEGQEDVLICAPAGWKSVGSLEVWERERDLVLEKIINLPVSILSAMHVTILGDNGSRFYDIISRYRDTRCESLCPECWTDDIEWSTKDVQDSIVYQNATCNKCGCEFTEEYHYTRTVVDEKVSETH